MAHVGMWMVYLKLRDEFLGSLSRNDDVSGSRGDEAFIDGRVYEWQQWVVVAINVQQTHLHKIHKFANPKNLQWF